LSCFPRKCRSTRKNCLMFARRAIITFRVAQSDQNIWTIKHHVIQQLVR
jgi:hypothetical protein